LIDNIFGIISLVSFIGIIGICGFIAIPHDVKEIRDLLRHG